MVRIGSLFIHKNSSPEFIIRVIDADYDHHRGITEYQVEVIKGSKDEKNLCFWVRSYELAKYEPVPKNHAAYILFGND